MLRMAGCQRRDIGSRINLVAMEGGAPPPFIVHL
jgi:hypothetical protein